MPTKSYVVARNVTKRLPPRPQHVPEYHDERLPIEMGPESPQKDGRRRHPILHLVHKDDGLTYSVWKFDIRDGGGQELTHRTYGQDAHRLALEVAARFNGRPDFVTGWTSDDFRSYIDRHKHPWLRAEAGLTANDVPRYLGLAWPYKLKGWWRPYVALMPGYLTRPDWPEQKHALDLIRAVYIEDPT